MACSNQNVLCSIAFKVQCPERGWTAPLPSREIVFLGWVQTRNTVNTALYCGTVTSQRPKISVRQGDLTPTQDPLDGKRRQGRPGQRPHPRYPAQRIGISNRALYRTRLSRNWERNAKSRAFSDSPLANTLPGIMARGRAPNLSLPPTRALTQQRDYRARKAARIAYLERTNKELGEDVENLRRELVKVKEG
jgi:hypothetical protein